MKKKLCYDNFLIAVHKKQVLRRLIKMNALLESLDFESQMGFWKSDGFS